MFSWFIKYFCLDSKLFFSAWLVFALIYSPYIHKGEISNFEYIAYSWISAGFAWGFINNLLHGPPKTSEDKLKEAKEKDRQANMLRRRHNDENNNYEMETLKSTGKWILTKEEEESL